ncbi:universal stress protein [Arthrobacter sp. TMN-49]
MVRQAQIVVGVDGSPPSRAALEWAAHRVQRGGSSLLLVHSVPDFLVSPGHDEYESVRAALEGMLTSEAASAREFAPGVEVQTILQFGEPALVLAELSASSAMVVVGNDRSADVHGEGFGAINLQLATIGRCPVAVIPARRGQANDGVVVGIDGSPQSMAAASFAAAEAVDIEQELTVVYVSPAAALPAQAAAAGPAIGQLDDTRGRMILETVVAAVRARHIHLTVCERFVHHDVPARALIDAGRGAAMLVVGNRGRGATHQAIRGSAIHELLQHVPCPVVLTPQDYADAAAGHHQDHDTLSPSPTPLEGS